MTSQELAACFEFKLRLTVNNLTHCSMTIKIFVLFYLMTEFEIHILKDNVRIVIQFKPAYNYIDMYPILKIMIFS